MSRASPSGISLTTQDASIVKAMLARGDRQHDVAAWFGVNGGRIAEIATGKAFPSVQPAAGVELPPPGPYPSGRASATLAEALAAAERALNVARRELGVRQHS